MSRAGGEGDAGPPDRRARFSLAAAGVLRCGAMIRRDLGADWLLITQRDHAAVAARLAGHVGGRRFAPLVVQRETVLAAVAGHDDGWASHDDEGPTLDERGRPLDGLAAPRAVALPAWAASADRAAGPYAGLLVSLHALSLSIRAAGPVGPGHTHFDLSDAHALFDVNKFQHREIERQEQLRRAVGLPTDVPLQHGIADAGTSGGDDRLAYHFRLLEAMDVLSLCLCCTRPPFGLTGDVLPAVGASPRRLRVERDLGGDLRVSPWPFDVARLELSVRGRRVPARPFDTVEAFRAAYAAAAAESFAVTVRG